MADQIITDNVTSEQGIAGIDTLHRLYEYKAGFTLCCGPECQKCNSPGKVPHYKGWQNWPRTLADAEKHHKAGGNVGILCDAALCAIDIDLLGDEFIKRAWYPDAPYIGRDDPTKVKVLCRLTDVPSDAGITRLKLHPRSEHNCIEFLFGGNAVVAGTHHSGETIRLINPDGELPCMTYAQALDLCDTWVEVLRSELLPRAEPELLPIPETTPEPEPPRLINEAAKAEKLPLKTLDDLLHAVLKAWTPLQVFEHFGLAAHGTQPEKDGWLRVFGNGGLFVKGEGAKQFWCLTGAAGGAKVPGGGAVQAWAWCDSGQSKYMLKGKEFVDTVKAMAEAAGYPLPAELVVNKKESGDNGRVATVPIAPPRLDRWTIEELLDAEIPEPKWSIPGLVPEGLTIIGGRPKVGKSWLALQMAASVGAGGRFFDKEVEAGSVLYIALEDGPRRLQDRVKKLRIPRHANITIVRDWPPFQDTGMAVLFDEIIKYNHRLVVVDTLTRAFRGLDQNDQPVISAVMDNVQRMAVDHNMSIVFNDHTSKPKGMIADPIDDIMNSTVKTAVADMVMALYRDQGKASATLRGRGRDAEEIDLAVTFDVMTCTWQCVGQSGQVKAGELRQDIIDVLRSLGRVQAPAVARALGRDRSNIAKVLNDLYSMQLVAREVVGTNVYYWVM